MATGSIPLLIAGAVLPDGTTGNAAPAIQRVKSSASAPSPFFFQLAFDASTDEMAWWAFRLPDNYASGPILKLQFKMTSATTGSVRWEGRLAAVTPGDATDVDAKALATTNSAGTAVAATAGYLSETSITLTNADSLAAGDFVIVYVRRDADGTTGTDDATGDAELVAASLNYTTV